MGEGPVEAIVYAHSQSSRCSILKGQLGNMWTRIPLRWANERGRALALHALDALLQFFKESELFSVARNSAWHCSLFGAALNAWRRCLRHRGKRKLLSARTIRPKTCHRRSLSLEPKWLRMMMMVMMMMMMMMIMMMLLMMMQMMMMIICVSHVTSGRPCHMLPRGARVTC